MGTTNPETDSLLPFFKRLSTPEGAVDAWRAFRAGEAVGDWGIIAFDPVSETLHGVNREEDGLNLTGISFFDWLSRRVRPEAHHVLTSFGNDLGACQSDEDVQWLRDSYFEELDRLKVASGNLHEEGVHQVLLVWLERMRFDVEAMTSDSAGRRRRRGGAAFGSEMDQSKIQQIVQVALADAANWHPKSSSRLGPIVSKVQRAVEDAMEKGNPDKQDSLLSRDPLAVRDRVERAITYVRTRYGVDGPHEHLGDQTDNRIEFD